uniref:Uncharacterized protein n=1 Tax=Anopheles culicifacies TaxID=139723 RepID=A0A182LZM0_9DIPT
MSVRWESPGIGRRRRSDDNVDECEISMLTSDDGDHSRSRNGSLSRQRMEQEHRASKVGDEVHRPTSGGRCPVAMVDADLSDDGESMLDPNDTDEIMVLDEASERLLGKWNGNAKDSDRPLGGSASERAVAEAERGAFVLIRLLPCGGYGFAGSIYVYSNVSDVLCEKAPQKDQRLFWVEI